MEQEEIKTEREARSHLIGRLAGINDIRIQFMGIGYDNNDTAKIIRQRCNDRIFEIKEILEIKIIGDCWLNSAKDILNKFKE